MIGQNSSTKKKGSIGSVQIIWNTLLIVITLISCKGKQAHVQQGQEVSHDKFAQNIEEPKKQDAERLIGDWEGYMYIANDIPAWEEWNTNTISLRFEDHETLKIVYSDYRLLAPKSPVKYRLSPQYFIYEREYKDKFGDTFRRESVKIYPFKAEIGDSKCQYLIFESDNQISMYKNESNAKGLAGMGDIKFTFKKVR